MNEQLDIESLTKQEIAVAVSITAQVKPGRQIVMQTYVGRDDPPAQTHALIDRLQHMVDRQEARDELPGALFQLEFEKKKYEEAKLQYVKIDERNAIEWEKRGKKGPPQLSKSVIEGKDNTENNMK